MPNHHPLHKIKKVKNSSIDHVISVIAIISPFSLTPQIIQIFTTKNVEGISLITWLISIAISFIWLAYGMRHKESPIITNSALGILLSSLVTFGILLYR